MYCSESIPAFRYLGFAGKGSDPEWNETFVFGVSDEVPELLIKILDSDGLSGDDFVGEAK